MTTAQHLIESALIALTETHITREEWEKQWHVQRNLEDVCVCAEEVWSMACHVCYPFKVEWENDAYTRGFEAGVQYNK